MIIFPIGFVWLRRFALVPAPPCLLGALACVPRHANCFCAFLSLGLCCSGTSQRLQQRHIAHLRLGLVIPGGRSPGPARQEEASPAMVIASYGSRFQNACLPAALAFFQRAFAIADNLALPAALIFLLGCVAGAADAVPLILAHLAVAPAVTTRSAAGRAAEKQALTNLLQLFCKFLAVFLAKTRLIIRGRVGSQGSCARRKIESTFTIYGTNYETHFD